MDHCTDAVAEPRQIGPKISRSVARPTSIFGARAAERMPRGRSRTFADRHSDHQHRRPSRQTPTDKTSPELALFVDLNSIQMKLVSPTSRSGGA